MEGKVVADCRKRMGNHEEHPGWLRIPYKVSIPTSPKANSRLIQPFLELGGWHEEGIEHGHTLGQHGDFQLVLCLQRLEEIGVVTVRWRVLKQMDKSPQRGSSQKEPYLKVV